MRKVKIIIVIAILNLYIIYGETISFAITEWAPFTSETLNEFGFASEIVKESMKAVGYSVDFKFYPWARCLYEVEEGRIEGIMPIYFNEERSKVYVFTNKIGSAKSALMALKDSLVPDSYETLQDLSNYKIGVRLGNVHSDEFDNASFLHKETSNEENHLVLKLLHRRVDIIGCSSLENINYLISLNHPEERNKVKVLSPYLSNSDLFVAFSRKNSYHGKLVNDFNRGLEIIQKNGTYNNILKKHGQ